MCVYVVFEMSLNYSLPTEIFSNFLPFKFNLLFAYRSKTLILLRYNNNFYLDLRLTIRKSTKVNHIKVHITEEMTLYFMGPLIDFGTPKTLYY